MASRQKNHSRFTSRLLLGLALISGLGFSRPVHAEPVREFVMSATYGALAGTLVGAATLAFTDQPGENLNRVARGASIGLYAGMLLGFYVVYGVDSGYPADDLSLQSVGAVGQAGEEPSDQSRFVSARLLPTSWRAQRTLQPRLAVMPLLGENGFEGASVRYRVLHF